MMLCNYLFQNVRAPSVVKVLVIGFCRLILDGHQIAETVMIKLLIMNFDPNTDPEIQAILRLFFGQLNRRQMQTCLQKALLPTISTALENPADILLDKLVQHVIASTKPVPGKPHVNIHNDLAITFLTTMNERWENRTILQLLAKHLRLLDVSGEPQLGSKITAAANELLMKPIDAKTKALVLQFMGKPAPATPRKNRRGKTAAVEERRSAEGSMATAEATVSRCDQADSAMEVDPE